MKPLSFVKKAVVFTVLTMLTAGCSLLTPLETNAKPQQSKWDRIAEKTNEDMDLQRLNLQSYAEQVGATLSSPTYRKFAVNSKVRIAGEVDRYQDLQSDLVWIEVKKTGKGADQESFSYYAPLKNGKFNRKIQLFAGKGKYQVTVRLPSQQEKDRYYDLARFDVININPHLKKDIAYTRMGHKLDLQLSQPKTGLLKAENRLQLKGSFRGEGTQRLMVRVEKGSERWEHLVQTDAGRFTAQVPLLYGKGLHKITLLTPDDQRKRYYHEAASLWVYQKSGQKQKPIEYFRHYEERGIKLESPLTGGGTGNMKYRIKGKIDPEAPDSNKTRHLIVQTKKDGQEATYIIPVKNYQFDHTFWLRFGPGEYEVTVNVPEITEERRDYFRFFGVARFTVNNSAQEDLRNLLPSRGIQSDSESIRKLAEKLTKGRTGDREKALAIYEYVSKNIRYDVQKYKNDEFEYDDSAIKTLQDRSGVCQDYSFLAVALLRSIDMETRFVEGYAEGSRHAWVEVLVDGKWLTMDPTWGSGYLNQQDQFISRYTTKYFDPDSGEFAKTHKRTGVMY